MEDFASSLLVRMIEHSLRAQGLAVPVAAHVPPVGPRVAGARKRQLIGLVLDRHGPQPLLLVGESVGEFADTPVARLFDAAETPEDLIERWLRVERYFHAKHRTRLVGSGADFVCMQHFATAGPAPSVGEDIVVASVMQGLLTRIGASETRLHFQTSAGDWRPLGSPTPTDTSRWRLSWRRFDRIARNTTTQVDPPVRTASGQELPAGLPRRLFQEAAADPGARRSLRSCAVKHGMSARSLQRRLGECGWTLRGIVAAMRLQVAANLLSQTEMPIALVGLCAGYSDQPHFQREFQKGLGPTPRIYRQLSQASKSPNRRAGSRNRGSEGF